MEALRAFVSAEPHLLTTGGGALIATPVSPVGWPKRCCAVSGAGSARIITVTPMSDETGAPRKRAARRRPLHGIPSPEGRRNTGHLTSAFEDLHRQRSAEDATAARMRAGAVLVGKLARTSSRGGPASSALAARPQTGSRSSPVDQAGPGRVAAGQPGAGNRRRRSTRGAVPGCRPSRPTVRERHGVLRHRSMPAAR
jgi:hypothetical protein